MKTKSLAPASNPAVTARSAPAGAPAPYEVRDQFCFAAGEIVMELLARNIRPQYLAKCGGIYSSEWFFSKILHCLRTSPEVFDAAWLWVECADWVPAMLTGTEAPDQLTIGVCAAGHKAMYNDAWGGYPDAEFLSQLDPKLGELRARLRPKAHTIDRAVGGLTAGWAKRTGLPAGIPVAAEGRPRLPKNCSKKSL